MNNQTRIHIEADDVGILPDADWNIFPSQFRKPLLDYIARGAPCPVPLSSFLTNDLIGAVNAADGQTIEQFPDILQFLQSFVPAASWSTRERYNAWVKSGGIKGGEACISSTGHVPTRKRPPSRRVRERGYYRELFRQTN